MRSIQLLLFLVISRTMPLKQQDDADLMVRYLVGEPASANVIALYHRITQNFPEILSSKDRKLWNTCLHHPWLLPHIDAWLGFRAPNHPIRRKLFVMLCVLEMQPDYSKFFLPSHYSFLHLFRFGFTCLWAIVKIITGRLITWII